jgi:hypothetical protein
MVHLKAVAVWMHPAIGRIKLADCLGLIPRSAIHVSKILHMLAGILFIFDDG